ncbi:MAG TPA: hypothetical protein VFX55_21345 [Duganella sp.]|nr:hypothetical protein [Duganella sp.]
MPNNFDAVAFMDSLVEGGFTEKQAKSLASALYQLIESQLVTKHDLELAFAKFELKIITYLLTLLVLQSGVTAVLFKLLH